MSNKLTEAEKAEWRKKAIPHMFYDSRSAEDLRQCARVFNRAADYIDKLSAHGKELEAIIAKLKGQDL